MRRYTSFLLTTIMAFALGSSVSASSFEELELIARANFRDGYQLPSGTYLTNMSPVINDRGDIAFQVVYNGQNKAQSLWYRKAGEQEGHIVYSAPGELLIGDVDLSEKGEALFGHFDFGYTEGIFSYSPQKGVTHVIDAKKFPEYASFSTPQNTSSGDIFSRTTNRKGARKASLFTPSNSEEDLVEVEGRGLSYLFSPKVEGSFIAMKVRHGETRDWKEENPDEIRLYNTHAGFQVIAEDRDSKEGSPYVKFHNTVGVSAKGHVSFVATMEDKKQALFVYIPESSEVVKVVKEGVDVQEIEYFPSQVNRLAHVAFRAKDMSGKRSVYVAIPKDKGYRVTKLLSEGDLVPTDRETGRILNGQETPGFSGSIDLNNNREILLHSIIESKKGEELLGAAVYKLHY